MTDDMNRFLHWRGLRPEDACLACRGTGAIQYGSTSTWRGGMGGAAMTRDVCDQCWGSGDRHEPWVDLRRLRDGTDAQVRREAAALLGNRMGGVFPSLRPAIEALCVVLDKESRRRKNPLGTDFWSVRNWELVTTQLAKVLRELTAAAENP